MESRVILAGLVLVAPLRISSQPASRAGSGPITPRAVVDRAQEPPQLGDGRLALANADVVPVVRADQHVVDAAHCAVGTEQMLDRIPVAPTEVAQIAPQPRRPVLLSDAFEKADRIGEQLEKELDRPVSVLPLSGQVVWDDSTVCSSARVMSVRSRSGIALGSTKTI